MLEKASCPVLCFWGGFCSSSPRVPRVYTTSQEELGSGGSESKLVSRLVWELGSQTRGQISPLGGLSVSDGPPPQDDGLQTQEAVFPLSRLSTQPANSGQPLSLPRDDQVYRAPEGGIIALEGALASVPSIAVLGVPL